MIRHLQSLARCGCAMIMMACANDQAPTAPGSGEHFPAPSLSTAGVAPTAEELATLPPEFSEAASIIDYGVTAGFTDDGAYAEAYMTYFATNAEQEATITVRLGATQIGTKTGRSVRHHLLPAVRTLFTIIGQPFAGSCGHIADAKGQHKVWHQLLIDWKFLSWGEEQVPSSAGDEQPQCEVPVMGGGSSDDPYEGECELCQQWFYFYRDGRVLEWWECRPLTSCSDTR